MVSNRRCLGFGLLAVAMLLAAGCADLDDPAAAHGLSRNDLVAELASQLAGSASQTFAATYQLAGGATATIAQAQHPLRAAYRYPGGEVLVTTSATTHCTKQSCTMTAPAATPPASVFADARKAGLVTPAVVEDLLNAARMDPDMTVDQHDTTVAGRHATCLELGNVDEPADPQPGTFPSEGSQSGATQPSATQPDADQSSPAQIDAGQSGTGQTSESKAGATRAAAEIAGTPSGRARPDQVPTDDTQAGSFSTCITSDGVVGSFTGMLHGTAIDVALTDYADKVAGDAFDPPPAAKLVDHRTR
jgi:hypothetical protein